MFTANTNASGVITGFNTVTAGSGYTAAPTITISAPGGTATVPAITVATGGGGYAPNLTNIAVTTVGGTTTGTPAVFTANTNSVGVITGFTTVTAGTGYTVAPSFTIAAPVAATGADIAITEGGTLNFAQVKAGPAGKLTAISTGGDIIQTTTGGVQVGGATALTSSSNVTLNVVGAANSFGGNAGIAITAPGNVSLQDAAATTALAGGSTIGGALTLKNTFGGGAIRDLSGTIAVAGSTWFDTGTTGSVNIGNSSITLGAVKFNSGTVTIVENATLDIAPGSVANGAVSLTSSGNIITSGTGGSGFQSTLTLSATGSIAITNPIFVVGAGTTGLVFRALGTVNLGVLSLSGNLNGIAPTNLGASTYTPPAP